MGKFENLEGLRFGKILVGKLHLDRDKRGNTLWNCKCDCGTERLIRATSLRTGATSLAVAKLMKQTVLEKRHMVAVEVKEKISIKYGKQ